MGVQTVFYYIKNNEDLTEETKQIIRDEIKERTRIFSLQLLFELLTNQKATKCCRDKNKDEPEEINLISFKAEAFSDSDLIQWFKFNNRVNYVKINNLDWLYRFATALSSSNVKYVLFNHKNYELLITNPVNPELLIIISESINKSENAKIDYDVTASISKLKKDCGCKKEDDKIKKNIKDSITDFEKRQSLVKQTPVETEKKKINNEPQPEAKPNLKALSKKIIYGGGCTKKDKRG
jgi:hypothetical protein